MDEDLIQSDGHPQTVEAFDNGLASLIAPPVDQIKGGVQFLMTPIEAIAEKVNFTLTDMGAELRSLSQDLLSQISSSCM